MNRDADEIDENWSRYQDGTCKKVGEMTTEEKMHVFRHAGESAARQMFSSAAMADREMRHGRKIH